ncbi:unnamed protein product [Laminaria digitata]
MMSSRVARGAGVLKQGLRTTTRGSHSPFTSPTYNNSSATANMATIALRPSCAAYVHQRDGYRTHRVRYQPTAAMPSSLGMPSAVGGCRALPLGIPVPSAVGGCRYFTGRRGGPTDEKRGGAKKDGAKAPYRFNEQQGSGVRSSSESKGDLETDSASLKAQDAKEEEEEEVEPTKNSMWMRVKRASSKMKLLWKQYGLVAIGTYTALYVAGFGGVYLVLVTGLVEPDVDTAAWIQRAADFVGAGENDWVQWIERTVRTNPNAEKVATAFIVNEFLEYPREFMVIAATPSIARALGRAPAKVTTEQK